MADCDIVICMLPLTAETRGILNARLFSLMPRGASIVNVARGGHLVESDLLTALDSGHIAGAALDVAEEEPLKPDHPFWRHPRILMTPHIATAPQPGTAIDSILLNIERHRRGAPTVGVVDRNSGY